MVFQPELFTAVATSVLVTTPSAEFALTVPFVVVSKVPFLTEYVTSAPPVPVPFASTETVAKPSALKFTCSFGLIRAFAAVSLPSAIFQPAFT